LELVFNEDTLINDPGVDYAFKQELIWLWHFANALEKRRGKYDPSRAPQLDYNFAIEDGQVLISPRKRGAPMDKLVSELMILANCEWGRMLGEAGIPGMYRAQSMGKVRMTTRPEPHIGLGVAQYAWSTSPLRRAADFVNQRQLVAMIRGETAPFAENDAMLFAVLPLIPPI
jgi:exoribonuclease-2